MPDLILPLYAAHPKTEAYDPSTGPQRLDGQSSTPVPTAGQRPLIYEKNLNRRAPEVNLAALTFLFSEMVLWTHSNSRGIQQLETKLNVLGYLIGLKILELSYLRENQTNGVLKKTLKKDVRIIEILQFIHLVIWKNLFGKTADDLEKSGEVENEFMIIDNDPIISQYISVPRDLKQLNCCAFVAGIIEGLLDSAFFQANVTAHNVPKEGYPLRTVYLVKFDDSVTEREMVRFG